MPKTEAYVAGRQVTVDNDQFNIKFTRTVEQLKKDVSEAFAEIRVIYRRGC